MNEEIRNLIEAIRGESDTSHRNALFQRLEGSLSEAVSQRRRGLLEEIMRSRRENFEQSE